MKKKQNKVTNTEKRKHGRQKNGNTAAQNKSKIFRNITWGKPLKKCSQLPVACRHKETIFKLLTGIVTKLPKNHISHLQDQGTGQSPQKKT